jgi:hypothetical protein
VTGFVCPLCGRTHLCVPALVLVRPDAWWTLSKSERSKGAATDDACYIPEAGYFISGVLTLPLVDGPEPVTEFGVWASVSEDDFKRYYADVNEDDQSGLGPMPGALANELRGFPGSSGLKLTLRPRDGRRRPSAELEPSDHPLALAQREGVAFATVLDITHRDGKLLPEIRDL